MKSRLIIFFELLLFSLVLSAESFSQMESVPVSNPVYEFLKRMEIKGVIEKYPNVILPLSRAEIAGLIQQIEARRESLSAAERDVLEDLKIEFAHELHLGANQRFVLFSKAKSQSVLSGLGSDKEKFLYAWVDSSNSFFLDALFQVDYLKGTGDLYGGSYAGVFSIGPRFRGTLKNRLGYFLQVTHSQFTGDEKFALSRPEFPQNRHLSLGFRDFDITEGYLRLDADVLRLQVGRERLLWGIEGSDRLILSGRAPIFDYFRIDTRYGVVSYTFFHAWLLGPERLQFNSYAGKNDAYLSSKYLAGHRVEVSLPRLLDIGLGELVVYSRRNLDLAYLNPVNFFKAIEPEFHDRDNALVVADVEVHALRNVEVYGSFLIDDIQIDRIGSDYFGNKFAYNLGVSYIEPLRIRDLDVGVEYVKIDPYVYSHNILENNFTNDGYSLGHRLGPNSDNWRCRVGYRFSRKWTTSAEVERSRHGANIVDGNGNLLKNVGGDVAFGHRDYDSPDAPFLDGILTKGFYVRLRSLYEIFNECFMDLRYEYRRQKNVSLGKTSTDHFFFCQLRFDL